MLLFVFLFWMRSMQGFKRSPSFHSGNDTIGLFKFWASSTWKSQIIFLYEMFSNWFLSRYLSENSPTTLHEPPVLLCVKDEGEIQSNKTWTSLKGVSFQIWSLECSCTVCTKSKAFKSNQIRAKVRMLPWEQYLWSWVAWCPTLLWSFK